MADIEYYFVCRRIKNIMESHSSFNYSKIRPDMASLCRQFLKKCRTQFFAYKSQVVNIQFLDICRRMNFINIKHYFLNFLIDIWLW